MKISEVILERIKRSHELDAYVKSAVSKISSHISSNSMVFFPEYTDHNTSHFEAVLETAVHLATEKSLELMSDVDLAILTTSIMLHDLGMYLTKDGFETLIDPSGPMKPIDGFSDPPWNELWLTFLAEARRFDARKLEDLFGPSYRPVGEFPSFEAPWNEFDVLIVGEFLRRHHPRLAHEIALIGMPSKDGRVIQFCGVGSDQAEFLNDMSGFVARSHGLALRQTFPYLEKKFSNKIETRSAHPVYLMTLLRIADYFQIQSARAPSARTDVTKFKSPISTREWSMHQCVTDVTNLIDPEAIDVTAKPNNIEIFLRLKYWITDLQRELDLSWAVLGEVYGLQAHTGLNKLGLRVRRLRSNIDNERDFAKTVGYMPKQIAFTAAGSDLLKLLVGPLYANDVSVGLRELVQNATDAVKELDNLVEQGAITRPNIRTDLSADVQVDFVTEEEGEHSYARIVKSVTITDRGVGMTPEVLQNYFLRAGASFRSSPAWKASFEKSDGSSRIQRRGRFGVGALAAFLLGDELTVETRHYSAPSEDGLKFTASIDASSINVVRQNCEVGTKIRIEIPKRLQKKVGSLLPGFYSPKVDLDSPIGNYFGRYPTLVYTINTSKLLWKEECLLPTRHARFQDPWNYFETAQFEVNWTYASEVLGLAVNEIKVSGKRTYNSYSPEPVSIHLKSEIFSTPSLSIGDNAGAFELNLQRSSYAASELPFRDNLLCEISDEFIHSCLWQLAEKKPRSFPRYAGFERSFGKAEPRWLECSDGIILNSPKFLKSYNPTFCLNRYGGDSDPTFFRKIGGALPERSIYFHDANDEFTSRQFRMKGKLMGILRGEALNFVQGVTQNRSVYIPAAFVDLILNTMKPGQDTKKLLEGLTNDTVPAWLVHSVGRGRVSEVAKLREWREGIAKNGKDTCVVSLHKLSCQNFKTKGEGDDVVFDRWMDLLGQPYLPRATNELTQLQCRLSDRLGTKFEIFERRAQEAQMKKELEEQDKNSDG
jgi:molecular chaperone HtpG